MRRVVECRIYMYVWLLGWCRSWHCCFYAPALTDLKGCQCVAYAHRKFRSTGEMQWSSSYQTNLLVLDGLSVSIRHLAVSTVGHKSTPLAKRWSMEAQMWSELSSFDYKKTRLSDSIYSPSPSSTGDSSECLRTTSDYLKITISSLLQASPGRIKQ